MRTRIVCLLAAAFINKANNNLGAMRIETNHDLRNWSPRNGLMSMTLTLRFQLIPMLIC
ncbi:hypothetical protein AAFG07_20895 [Bradyrhizobium sp. B097]|uniref:hypothetical protein n=1 Tax=Bradyrhizobium sp. B097 TaxID=3140244 RepID=UPI0031843C70